MTFKKKASNFGALQTGDGERVIKKAQKNIAKNLGGVAPSTVGLSPDDDESLENTKEEKTESKKKEKKEEAEESPDVKLMKKIKTYMPASKKAKLY